jgi:hypothetical protein
MLEQYLGKKSDVHGRAEPLVGIEELAAGITRPVMASEDTIHAVYETLQSLVEEVTCFILYGEEGLEPPSMILPEKSKPHLWEIHLEPTEARPEEEGAPLRELCNYSRERMSMGGFSSDTLHRYRALNRVSDLALIDDERGYPVLGVSHLPTEAVIAATYEQVRGIAVPLKAPEPNPPAANNQSPGFETFVKKEHPRQAARIMVKDTLEELVHHTDSALKSRVGPAGRSIWCPIQGIPFVINQGKVADPVPRGTGGGYRS